MSRIVFDHNVPATLRPFLAGHAVRTADEEGWGQVANGALIQSAEDAGFDVLLTCDQNLSYQQNLSKRSISLIVLTSNNWPLLQTRIQDVIRAVARTFPCSFEVVEIKHKR